MSQPSFPFPLRNPHFPNDDDIIAINPPPTDVMKTKFRQRALTKDAKRLKAQYLEIEDELVRSFTFVAPSDKNRSTYSIAFGSIIKRASSTYELVCRDVYVKFFDPTHIQQRMGEPDINIRNFLSLEKFLGICNIPIESFIFEDGFPSAIEVKYPFRKLSTWNKASVIEANHTPDWWTAYNKLKHSNTGLEDYATLASAIAALAALYLLITKVYGLGVVSGDLVTPDGGIYSVPVSTVFSPLYVPF